MRDFEYQPAADVELGHAERLTDARREAGLCTATTHRLGRAAMRTYLRLSHRLTVEGREHLPADPPCVVVANHTSHLDAPALTAALPACWCARLYTLAAQDVFFVKPQQAALAALLLNALPVDRQRGRRHAIRNLRDKLTAGHAFLLFPEGTRSRDGTLQPFLPGLGLLVAGGEVPVVPAYLAGAFTAWPAKRRLPRPGRLTVRFGPPLRFADLRPDREGCAAVARACREAVAQLAPPTA